LTSETEKAFSKSPLLTKAYIPGSKLVNDEIIEALTYLNSY